MSTKLPTPRAKRTPRTTIHANAPLADLLRAVAARVDALGPHLRPPPAPGEELTERERSAKALHDELVAWARSNPDPALTTHAETVIEDFIRTRLTSRDGVTLYTPEKWRARNEKWGNNAVLVVCHENCELNDVFNAETRRDVAALRALEKQLARVGLYSESLTNWATALYPIE